MSQSLHKSLDGDNPGFDILSCVNCHNPHGERRSGNDIYPKLLKVTYNNTTYYEGNQICYFCHGNVNRGFEGGVYYSVYGGNHINPLDPNNPDASNTNGPVHYDNVNFGSYLNPSSGTKITCMMCHEKHGSQYANLLDNSGSNSEEQLCFKSGCHGTGGTQNKYNDFFGGTVKSRHEITDTAKGKVECTSCHGPHTVDNNQLVNGSATVITKISDPDNTKNWYYATNGVIDGFCLKCHDGNPPVKTATETTIVPYTITFNDIGFTNSSLGWNKKVYYGKAYHLSGGVVKCNRCHTYHGSTYGPNLLQANSSRPAEVTDTANQICSSTCHYGSPPGSEGSSSISFTFWTTSGGTTSLPYVHPALTTNGVHSDTEDWAGRAVGRHSECFDCHDVHSSGQNSTSEVNKLGSITGVVISDWNGANWNNWSSTTPTWSLQGLDPGNGSQSKQYQLCLKCHSKFSYINPPDSPSSVAGGYWGPDKFQETDLAKEFNPANPAGHKVIGRSQDLPAGYGKFVGTKTNTTTLKCTDCHGYSDSKGTVHGSYNRFILRRPWSNNTGKPGTSGDLCFKCHDFNFYTGADLGSPTVKSQFSVSGSVYQYNAHSAAHASYGCIACHGPVHGWPYTDSAGGGLSLHLQSDPRPYSDGVLLTSFDVINSNTPENWQKETCNGCH